MKTSRYIVYFGMLFLILSCDSPTESNFENYVYPLSLENTWIYEGSLLMESMNDRSEVYDISYNDTIIVDSIYSEIDNIYRFKTITSWYPTNEDQNISGGGSTGFEYFSNTEEGLYFYSHLGDGSSVVPWSSINSRLYYKINGELFSINELISLLNHKNISYRGLDETPLLSIKYPIIIGEQWNYRDGIPWIMDKRVIEDDGQTFTIQTLYDMDQDLSWEQDLRVFHTYSNIGLVNFRLEVDSLIMMDEIGNSSDNYYRSIQNHNLIEYQID